MSVYSRYLLALVVSIFFCSSAVMAVETVIERDIPSKVKPVSIDALVAKYHAASDKDAYKIMNQIKQEIARMSQERQSSAIGKVRQSVAQKELVQQQEKHPEKKISIKEKEVSKKHKKVIKKQKKQIKKKKKQIKKQKKYQQKRVKKYKTKTKKVRKHVRHTEKHPDPMSVISGTSGSTDIHEKATNSFGGSMGGSMGGMGSGMGGF